MILMKFIYIIKKDFHLQNYLLFKMNDKTKEFVISKFTKEKVQSAKNFIENRYSKLIYQQQQKKEYWGLLNQKMMFLGMSPSEQQDLKNQINHEQAQILRQQRKKITIYDFKSIRIIGKGAFGQVRLCKWNKSNEPVAVKKLKKQEMIFKNKIMQSKEERNALAFSQNNAWVVGLKCSFQDADNLYLVMEYLPGGDLMSLLMKKDIFSHEQAQFYTAQILLALDSVHKMKYIHRDLKPDNILLDINGHLKLSDFGLCKHTQTRPNKLTDNFKKQSQGSDRQMFNKDVNKDYHRRNRKLAYSAVGTPDYVAPEVQGKIGYNQTVDWWSMGIILFEMLVGYPPFASESPRQTWYKIQNWRKFFCIPSDANVNLQAADLIRKLIADPKQRLGINGVEQIKTHPFFIGINWNRLRDKKAPYLPEVNHSWDTQNFDTFQEEDQWHPTEVKGAKGRKKNPQFIGYTYKPNEESNSALIKALVDLETYTNTKIDQNKDNNLEYLPLSKDENFEEYPSNLFKKALGKTDRASKQISASTAISGSRKNDQKQKQRYKFYFEDTPQKKPSPGHKFAKKSPKGSPKNSQKCSPKQTSKQSPTAKDKQQHKAKIKILQKKYGA